jgi:hypothetical protein
MLRRPDTSDFKHQRVRVKRTVRTLLSPEQLNQAMGRESARVDRRGAGVLSLVLFRVPQAERNTLSAVRLAKTILKRIRVTDDVGWFDDQHLGVLLPETPTTGAWRLAQEVCDVVAKRGPRPLCTMYTYSGEGQGVSTQTAAVDPRTPAPAPAIKVAS